MTKQLNALKINDPRRKKLTKSLETETAKLASLAKIKEKNAQENFDKVMETFDQQTDQLDKGMGAILGRPTATNDADEVDRLLAEIAGSYNKPSSSLPATGRPSNKSETSSLEELERRLNRLRGNTPTKFAPLAARTYNEAAASLEEERNKEAADILRQLADKEQLKANTKTKPAVQSYIDRTPLQQTDFDEELADMHADIDGISEEMSDELDELDQISSVLQQPLSDSNEAELESDLDDYLKESVEPNTSSQTQMDNSPESLLHKDNKRTSSFAPSPALSTKTQQPQHTSSPMVSETSGILGFLKKAAQGIISGVKAFFNAFTRKDERNTMKGERNPVDVQPRPFTKQSTQPLPSSRQSTQPVANNHQTRNESKKTSTALPKVTEHNLAWSKPANSTAMKPSIPQQQTTTWRKPRNTTSAKQQLAEKTEKILNTFQTAIAKQREQQLEMKQKLEDRRSKMSARKKRDEITHAAARKRDNNARPKL
ncbi:hypothetical protein [Legionella yabuuchiae]|uniref:hypothetical protein n=1 Tax=Legionella yabuuchiae TaxID=376727 RepID=UPI0010551404|nr:hypothetical protein [Legionella yabuuchiae]